MNYYVSVLAVCLLSSSSMHAMEKADRVESKKTHRRTRSAICSFGGDSISKTPLSAILSDSSNNTDYVYLDIGKGENGRFDRIPEKDLLNTLEATIREDINATVALRLMCNQSPAEATGKTRAISHKRGSSQVDALAYELSKAHITTEILADRLSKCEKELRKGTVDAQQANESYRIGTVVLLAGLAALTNFISTVVVLSH